ncbi:hypothetical protein ORL93_26045 [Bacillus sp. DHT2]|uniref:hypothetical protein n=1 Tax=Bacillus sp. DHT2 TaxID=2994532 RepID=UPI002248B234|nr:hypothetical protein [Bacillus sp. DHT2]MCX2829134.1 hypothetical protein [Bacillus sp. DHT2]
MKTYEKRWEEFWKPIVMKDGQVDIEQVKKELSDYKYMLEQVPQVYEELAGLSKPLTSAKSVIAAHEQQKEYAKDVYLIDISDMAEEDGKVQLSDIEEYFNR